MFYDLHYIASMLKDGRKRAALTQGELAMRAGVSRATINALENLKARDVNVNTLSQLFDAIETARGVPANLAGEIHSQPQFDFPYVWSNAHPSDDLLIIKVLERAIFKDVLHLCKHYGVVKVSKVFYASTLKEDALLTQSVTRMLKNIQKGFLLSEMDMGDSKQLDVCFGEN